jgi:branched-chain amino acid aminotransferase
MAPRFEHLVVDGDIVPYEEAKIHISTPAVRYGATVFEGIRAYWNQDQKQLYLFRCMEHFKRLLQSAKLMGMENCGYNSQALIETSIELLRKNSVREDVHIRPSLFITGEGSIQASGPVSFGIGIAPAGTVIPRDGWKQKPFRMAVSSWRRIEDNSMPPRIKVAANYQNSRMALLQSEYDGYDGVVLLDAMGHVTEEARACVFLVIDGVLVTPQVSNDILESITRASVIQILTDVYGIDVVERDVDRTELYLAEEIFLAGTAFGVAPVGFVDRMPVGEAIPGRITADVDRIYSEVAMGASDIYSEWRTPVYN